MHYYRLIRRFKAYTSAKIQNVLVESGRGTQASIT